MNWISKSREFVRAGASDPTEETVINDVPYDARPAIQDSSIRGAPEAPTVPDGHTAEEIKRRQISLALRYVTAVRAR